MGGKLVTIYSFGSDLPFWDQWAKEGEHILIPWFRDQSFTASLFAPHNEHRIVPTLSLNLSLVIGGGQWDARVQCIASAMVHATLLVSIVGWAYHQVGKAWGLSVLGLAVLIGALPIVWDNVLGGFQSQYYFLAAFSLLAIERLLSAPPLSSVGWWTGIVSAFVSLVCMGSGLLVAVPVLVLVAVRVVHRESSVRDNVATLVAASMVLGVGIWLHADAPWHETLRAKDLTIFVLYVFRSMAWPVPDFLIFALVIWGPWAALTFRRFRGHRTLGTDTLIAAGIWVLSQFAAVAYSRAGGSGYPASRYGDISALGIVIGFLSLAVLTTAWPIRARRACGWIAGGFIIVALVIAVVPRIKKDLPERKVQYLAYEEAVRHFIANDKFEDFEKRPLPFPLADWLARILRDPSIRAVMPGSSGVSLTGEDQVQLSPIANRNLSSQEWESKSIEPGAAFWRFQITGSLERSAAHLSLVDSAGTLLRTIPLNSFPGGSRQEIFTAAPPVISRIKVRLESSADNFILVLPRAVTWMSWIGWRLASWGWIFLLFAMTGLLYCAFRILGAHPRGKLAVTSDKQTSERAFE